jgi:two-component system, LuxR family, sensor kinase FixL
LEGCLIKDALVQMNANSIHDSVLNDPALNEFVQALMDTILEGLVVASTAGEIIAFSRAAQQMFGYSTDEAIGRQVNMLMPSPHREQHNGFIRSYLETGDRKIIGIGRRLMAQHRSGREFPVHLEVGEATIGPKHIFLGFISDLSADEQQRNQIRVLTSQLAHASRVTSMGMLAGAIAHELNQPLTAIQNYAETVSALTHGHDPIDREMIREVMDACTEQTKRAGEIIRRFRHFMASGEVEHARNSISGLVSKALALALADGEGAGVQVRLMLDVAADEVLVDGVEVEQVVFNLVRNALQAMEGQLPRVIRLSSVAASAMLEVIVEDSGPGLDTERQEQLFVPFASSKPGGLGLGLMICQTIIEAHGGRIWATQSDLGGAAFHFTIPRFVSESIDLP